MGGIKRHGRTENKNKSGVAPEAVATRKLKTIYKIDFYQTI